MQSISKALAAGGGGAVVGTAIMPFLPAGTPWWGYVTAFAVATLAPAIATYVAPPNKGSKRKTEADVNGD